MGVTYHTITEDWELKSITLKNDELPESHTAENLANALSGVMSNWHLQEYSLSAVTVDNAANIQKAINDVLGWKCLGCFGHTINLCVKAGLKQKDIDTAVLRVGRLVVGRLVRFFRKSARAAHTLIEKQDAPWCLQA